LPEISLAKDTNTNEPIWPICHCYSNDEEIYADQNLVYDNIKNSFSGVIYVGKICDKVVLK
jgi:hypothetical protein